MPRSASPSPRRPTRGERALMLGGLGAALAATPVLVALGLGTEAVQATWLLAALWTAGAELGCALWRCVRGGGDGPGLGRAPAPECEDAHEWASGSGRYAYLRALEEDTRRGDDLHI